MLVQTTFDFTIHEKENNSASKAILEANKEDFKSQCLMVKAMLESGYRLTVRGAMIDYGIGDLRARIRDLRDSGMDISDKLLKGRFKEYYL